MPLKNMSSGKMRLLTIPDNSMWQIFISKYIN